MNVFYICDFNHCRIGKVVRNLRDQLPWRRSAVPECF